MPYYRSTAYIISQGFQKFLICYFWIFLQFAIIFQSLVDYVHIMKNKRTEAFALGSLSFSWINPQSAALFNWVTRSTFRTLQKFLFMREILLSFLFTESQQRMAWPAGSDSESRQWRRAAVLRANPGPRVHSLAHDGLRQHSHALQRHQRRAHQRLTTMALREKRGLAQLGLWWRVCGMYRHCSGGGEGAVPIAAVASFQT